MLTYTIVGSEKFKTKSFSKLVKFLQLSQKEDKLVPDVEICCLDNPLRNYRLYLDQTDFDQAIKMIMEQSINICSNNKFIIDIIEFNIGKQRNIWEAIIRYKPIDDMENRNILYTENVEWPMLLEPDAFYIFCLFRYLTGVNTTITPAKDGV